MSKVLVKHILLGPSYTPNRKDIGNYLFGQLFQARLREDKHRDEKSKYRCKLCNGRGFILPLYPPASKVYKTEELLLKDLAVFSHFEMEKGVIEVLASLGLDTSKQVKKNGKGLYSAATIIYDQWLPKVLKARADANTYIEEVEQVAKAGTYDEQLERLKQIGKKLKKTKIQDQPLLIQCPSCLGNGYYDVSHEDIFGKQVSMMLWLYAEYIAGGKNKWNAKLSTSKNGKLYKQFASLDVRPDIPDALKFDVPASQLIDKKINRWHKYTQQNSSAKKALYEKYEKVYLGQSLEDEADVTYEEVLNFYKRLWQTSRIDTGTLKEELHQGYLALKKDMDTYKDSWKDFSAPHPYIGKFLFIEGPIARKASKSGNAFVYGARFVPRLYDYGKGDMVWSKKADIDSLIDENFKKANELRARRFFVFFPQLMRKHYG